MSNINRPSAEEGFPISNKDFLAHFRSRLDITEAPPEDSLTKLLNQLAEECREPKRHAANPA